MPVRISSNLSRTALPVSSIKLSGLALFFNTAEQHLRSKSEPTSLKPNGSNSSATSLNFSGKSKSLLQFQTDKSCKVSNSTPCLLMLSKTVATYFCSSLSNRSTGIVALVNLSTSSSSRRFSVFFAHSTTIHCNDIYKLQLQFLHR